MGTKLKNKQNTPATPVTDYLKARDFRDQRLWMLRQGKLYTHLNGKLVTREEFDRIHPVPTVSFFYKALENPDKTKNYL